MVQTPSSLLYRYIKSMVSMFGDSTLHGIRTLQAAAWTGQSVELENLFSRLTLDIIGKAVFNYEFDSLTNDDPVIKVCYELARPKDWGAVFTLHCRPCMRLRCNMSWHGRMAGCRHHRAWAHRHRIAAQTLVADPS